MENEAVFRPLPEGKGFKDKKPKPVPKTKRIRNGKYKYPDRIGKRVSFLDNEEMCYGQVIGYMKGGYRINADDNRVITKPFNHCTIIDDEPRKLAERINKCSN